MGNKRWKNVNQRTSKSTFDRICPKAKITFTFIEHALKQRSKFGDPVNSACKGQGQFRPICCFVSTQVHESATIISNSILATIISLITMVQVYGDSYQYCRLLLPSGIEQYIYFVIYLILDFKTNGKHLSYAQALLALRKLAKRASENVHS